MIKRNAISNVLLNLSKIAFPFITFPYVAHTLSREGLGRVVFTDTIVQYLLLISLFGVPLYGIREIAKVKKDNEKKSKLVRELFTINLLLAIATCCLFIFLFFQIEKLHHYPKLVAIGLVNILAFSLMLDWFFQGTEQFGFLLWRTLFVRTLSVAIIFALVKTENDFEKYYLAGALTVLVNMIINLTCIFRSLNKPFTFISNISKHLKPLSTILATQIMVTTYTVTSPVLLGFLSDNYHISGYNIAYTPVKLFWGFVANLSFVLIPRLVNLDSQNKIEEAEQLLKKSLSIILLATIPFAIFFIVFAKEILEFLGGAKYENGFITLSIFAFMPVFVCASNLFGNLHLISTGRERLLLQMSLICSIIFFSLSFTLIPRFNAEGAAASLMITEIISLILIFILSKRKVLLVLDASLVKQISLALVITILVSISFKHMNLPVIPNMIIFCSSYLFSFLLLQTYFKNEFVSSLLKYLTGFIRMS